MKKPRSPRQTNKAVRGHSHRADRCLNILKQLSAYIDDELPSAICDELRRHLGACPNCEEFIGSLRQTVTLCRHRPTPTLSADDRAQLRLHILRAATARTRR